jgi:short subunit dehydrogenase-like uncharacterized protein
MSSKRRYDIVLLGATGFTGSLTADYLAAHAQPDTRWALAGRSQAKLAALRSRLSASNPACAELPLLVGDVEDADSMRELAASTRVAITTVGPYITLGEPLVAACAETGTDYLDITGESEFVDRMYLRYHQRAAASGSRLVHCCGFESAPHDLGAYFTVKQLPERVPIRLEGLLRLGLGGSARASGKFSSGSLRSAITMLSRPRERTRAASARRSVEARRTTGRAVARRTLPRYVRSSGEWILPARTIDSEVVCRSAATLDCYGPEFSYVPLVAFDRPSRAAGMACGVAVVFLLAQLPPTRNMLLRRLSPGAGPTPAQRESRWFSLRFAAAAGHDRVVTEVTGGDPGYGETSKILAEASLCLAHDVLPARAGQLTPAVAMGEALIARLQRSGISFRVRAREELR